MTIDEKVQFLDGVGGALCKARRCALTVRNSFVNVAKELLIRNNGKPSALFQVAERANELKERTLARELFGLCNLLGSVAHIRKGVFLPDHCRGRVDTRRRNMGWQGSSDLRQR